MLVLHFKEKKIRNHHFVSLSGMYDVVLGAGILAPGHLAPSSIINIFRLIKPGELFQSYHIIANLF